MRRLNEGISLENRCFGMLHVRLATVFVGLWQILVNIIIISIFLYLLLINPQLSNSTKSNIDDAINLLSLGQRRDFIFNMREKYIFYKTPKTAAISHPDHNLTMVISSKVLPLSNGTQDYYVALSISIFTISFCVMMIIGTIKIKPPYISPYFCVEIFYFVVNSLTLFSEFSGMPLRNEYDKANGHTTYFKWNNSKLDRRQNILLFVQGLLLLSLNLYILNVVWLCYKFLLRVLKGLELDHGFSISMRTFQFPSIIFKLRRFILFRKSRIVRNPTDDRDNDSLLTEDNGRSHNVNQNLEDIEADSGLPKYEDLLLVPANANMPPPYYSTEDRK